LDCPALHYGRFTGRLARPRSGPLVLSPGARAPSYLSLPVQPGQGPLVVGSAARQQAEAPEAALVAEEQLEPEIDVGPAEDPVRGGAGRVLDHFIGWAQIHVDLAAIGAPAGDPLVGEPLIGLGDAAEVGVERLVLRR